MVVVVVVTGTTETESSVEMIEGMIGTTTEETETGTGTVETKGTERGNGERETEEDILAIVTTTAVPEPIPYVTLSW